MALHLIDGLPGSGKTQLAIKKVIEMSTATDAGRPVYFDSGVVADKKTFRLTPVGVAKLGWHSFDANDWSNCPDGSIIFIDEVQLVWPVRASGSKVPDAVAALATHRHRGFDFVIVCQDGSLIDQNVRKIVNPYTHLERPTNQLYSKVWEFNAFCSWGDAGEQSRAQVSRISMDKGTWELYESATVHTMKPRIPKRLVWIPVCVVVIVGGGWLAWTTMQGIGKKVVPPGAVAASGAPGAAPGVGGPNALGLVPRKVGDRWILDKAGGESGEKKKHQTVEEWLADRKPRIPQLVYTAPLYDELTKPVSFPVVSMCTQRTDNLSECACYSQQGTVMDVGREYCEMFIAHGQFDHFRPDPRYGVRNYRDGVGMSPARPTVVPPADAAKLGAAPTADAGSAAPPTVAGPNFN